MPNVARITGVVDVLKNLRRRHLVMAAGVQAGLKIAGLKLQRASQNLVPVEYGVLKASAFTRSEGIGFHTVVTVGYTASYALFVHQIDRMSGLGKPRPSGKGNYWDPRPRAQHYFLSEPAVEMAAELRQVILTRARIR